MDKIGVNRVHYFPRQVLRTQDFVDEQAYHLEARRRHNIGQHIWGIVSGFELRKDPDGVALVTPGFAIDGFGRELVLPAGRAITASAFDEKLAESLDIWAVYSRTAGDLGDPAYQPCVSKDQRTPYRWSEIASIESTRAGDDLRLDPELGIPECRQPPDVSTDDLNFDPTRVAPDDPSVRWPVFLGRITRTRSADKTDFVIDTSGRPYAGARAEAVVTPAGGASLQIGDACDNAYRLAFFLRDETLNPPQLVPRLTLGRNGDWTVAGTTTVRGDLTVDGGAVQFGKAVGPMAPIPWRIYRVQEDAAGGAAVGAGTAKSVDELRIVMQGPGAAGTNQVAIGVFVDGKFKPCLTVADDCTVTIYGDLIVHGKIVSEISKAALSEQAKAIAASVFTGGLMQSLNLVIGGSPGAHKLAFIEAALTADPEGTVDALAAQLRERPELLTRFRDAIDASESPKTAGSHSAAKGAARKRGLPKDTDDDSGTPEE